MTIFSNLYHHEINSGLTAAWNFFATLYGKNFYDGIGATTKRGASLASLQRPITNQIMTSLQLLNFCNEDITSIKYFYVSSEGISLLQPFLEKRFLWVKTIPGIPDGHCFIPILTTTIKIQRILANATQLGFQSSKNAVKFISMEDLELSSDQVKELLPHINKVIYFDDGCATQYKNCIKWQSFPIFIIMRLTLVWLLLGIFLPLCTVKIFMMVLVQQPKEGHHWQVYKDR